MFTCGVFIDVEKAFNTVNHHILLSKLYHYGVIGVANASFSSYLTNHTKLFESPKIKYLGLIIE